MILDIDKFLEAEYEWASMEGTYYVPCKIHGWDDKSERFAISFFDPLMQEIDYRWTKYDTVRNWTWQYLLENLKQN